MTVITRWDPFREYSTLQDRMNRLFRDSFGSEGREESLTTSTFAPPVDVYEDEQNLILKLEIPGVEESDLNVSVEDNTLTVQGERKFEKSNNEKGFHRIERSYGNFTRSFAVPNTFDTENIAATFKNGVLTVKLPKREAAKPRTIKIETAN